MTIVIPAIIPINRRQMEEEIAKVSNFANIVQIDISDGIFTSVKTWPYNLKDIEYFNDLKKEKEGWPSWQKIDIELHMMVQNPENIIEDWISTGVSGVVVHIEATENFGEIIDICKEKEISLGVAIKPQTSIDSIESFISSVDFVQVMGSNSLGRHGENLDQSAVSMVKTLRERFPLSIIAIDIGVTEETAETLVSAGVNKLISGGTILNSENPKAVFEYLQSL